MDKEKEIEKFAFSLIGATSPLGVKDLTKRFDYKTVAEYLINAGYGDVKQAIKEFAEELEEKFNQRISYLREKEELLHKAGDNRTAFNYMVAAMELEQSYDFFDEVITELYGEEE